LQNPLLQLLLAFGSRPKKYPRPPSLRYGRLAIAYLAFFGDPVFLVTRFKSFFITFHSVQ